MMRYPMYKDPSDTYKCQVDKCLDVMPHSKYEVDAEIKRLREALECLVLVVGLTAFKYEGQRSALQEAVNYAQTALAGKDAL
jgi:hypothetical protein